MEKYRLAEPNNIELDVPGFTTRCNWFRQVEQIFDSVIDCKQDKRTAQMDRLCGDDSLLRSEVLSLLLAAERSDGFLSKAPEAVEQIFADKLEPDSLLNQKFGPYRLLHMLERGGMGVVFLAERADGHYDQRVAIKFANYQIGVSSLMERFHTERQILANIRHPNVARLLDGGTSADGFPYIVMEYTPGLPIDSYCQINKLSTREILTLFLTVCETVQHAQQNLIVHCDLKPDNIIVGADGNPKLLDFGIAQLLDPIRRLATKSIGCSVANPMTPEYAAPEQLFNETVTTATDVYALGIVLYKLLTGSLPESSLPAGRADRTTADVIKPSSMVTHHVRRQLRGDIDNIVARALSVKPDYRYSSAQQMAEDIRNYLDGHVVAASDTGVAYRCDKFLRRHRLSSTLAAVSILSVLLGITTTTMHWQNAMNERELSERRLHEVRELANTIVFDLPQTIAALPGTTPLREQLLNQGIAYLDRLSRQQPDVDVMQDLAAAYHDLATLQGNPIMANLGDPESALNHYLKSISIREALLADNPGNHQILVELAESYSLMSGIHGAILDDAPKARALVDQCLTILEPISTMGVPAAAHRVLVCHTIGAHWANVAEDYSGANRYLIEADRLLATFANSTTSLPVAEELRLRGRLHEEWAQISASSGDYAKAISHERKRLALWSQIPDKQGKRARRLGAAHHGLAARLASVGNDAEALTTYYQSLMYWNDWKARFPADVSATHSIAIVHAELADLHWHMLEHGTVPIANPGMHRQQPGNKTACEHYRNSIAALNASTGGSSPLPSRYSWSPTEAQIRRQALVRCKYIIQALNW